MMDADVLVVGGGPAGSSVALGLARAGYRVRLLERTGFPRRKACGESVNVGAVGELDQLGVLGAIEALPHTRVDDWRVDPLAGPAFTGRLQQHGIAIHRAVLDTALLQEAARAGVQIDHDAQVADLVFDSDRVAGVRLRNDRELRARFVVGADGLRSVVVRRLGLLSRSPRLRKIGLTGHVVSAGIPLGVGELRLTEWGCAGIVRIDEEQTNVAIVLAHGRKDLVGHGREEAFDRLIRGLAGMEDARRVGPVLATGPFDWPVRRVTAPGALLVGDAAGYYDPFTGQGIFRALRGGRLAANAIDRAFRAPSREAALRMEYQHRLKGSTRWKVGLQHVIEAVTSRPRVMSRAAGLFAAHPSLANRLIAVTGDAEPISHLIRGRA